MVELENKIKQKYNAQVAGCSSISGKVRRRRTVYNRLHLDILLKAFETNPYPGITLREKLSSLTGIHESRIQVWFQNRRARVNKRNVQERENLPPQEEWCQYLVPQTSEQQLKREFCTVEHTKKPEPSNKNYVLPFLSLSHFHMNSGVGIQHYNYGWPQKCEVTNPMSSTGTTAQQYHPYIQQVSSSHLQHTTRILGTTRSENQTDFVGSLQPTYGPIQELSLQDILEEFQTCWTEVANNSYIDDLL